jgi:uncharacterized protein
MGADSNIQVIKDVYDAFGRGDVDAILDACTDDVDWSVDAASGDAPWWGQRTGKDAVGEFFAALAEATEVTEFSPESFAANDDGEVMTAVSYGFRAKATGKEGSTLIHHLFRLRDGKVSYWRGSEDTQLTASTLA